MKHKESLVLLDNRQFAFRQSNIDDFLTDLEDIIDSNAKRKEFLNDHSTNTILHAVSVKNEIYPNVRMTMAFLYV